MNTILILCITFAYTITVAAVLCVLYIKYASYRALDFILPKIEEFEMISHEK